MTRPKALAAILAIGVVSLASAQSSPRAQQRLEREVHHELVMLPLSVDRTASGELMSTGVLMVSAPARVEL